MNQSDSTILALDVGEVRIGIARANSIARVAEPLDTFLNDETFTHRFAELLENENVTMVVVGLPQNAAGQDTQQTTFVRDFVASLQMPVGIAVHFQDEANSSQKAESFLKSKKQPYTKAAIDAEAARIILDDFLSEQHPNL